MTAKFQCLMISSVDVSSQYKRKKMRKPELLLVILSLRYRIKPTTLSQSAQVILLFISPIKHQQIMFYKMDRPL
jgi:hypothetical protein